MEFRYARHTDDIARLITFYTEVIGLQVLGSFENHDTYNGVFLGFPQMDWHIEFTESSDKVAHSPDEDDVIVFYVNSDEALKAITQDAKQYGVHPVKSKNPYWNANGVEFKDPDGFGVIISVRQKTLTASDTITQLFQSKGVATWNEALEYIKAIPYGRNVNRADVTLVLSEKKGTCSSKHALLYELAQANAIKGVELCLGIYKMNDANTKGVGSVLSQYGVEYIPEAHCYLKINGKHIDVTNATSDISSIIPCILQEVKIESHQVSTYKVAYHKAYLTKWREDHNINKTFAEIWEIREMCIQALSNPQH